MSMKELKQGKTQPQAEGVIRAAQDQFAVMKNDMPASEIGPNDLHYLRNMHSFPDRLEVRTGSLLYSDTPLPTIRDGITASRLGDTVTSAGQFVSTDGQGKYLIWPDGHRDQITGYNDINTVTTRQDTDVASVAGCSIGGAVYGCFFFKRLGRAILHIDERLFVSENTLNGWTEVVGLSHEGLTETKTLFCEYEDYVIAFNEGGIFKIYADNTYPYYYKMNSRVPTYIIGNEAKSEVNVYGRRYVYSVSRFRENDVYVNRAGVTGDATMSRGTIEQESGTNEAGENNIDYGEVFTANPVGPGGGMYERLVCETAGVQTIETDIATWQAVTDGTFRATLNGYVQDISCDFSSVFSLDDVRRIIQDGLRVFCSTATVDIEDLGTNVSRFIITSGKYDGSTISELIPTGAGTDIAGIVAPCLRGTVGVAAVQDTPVDALSGDVEGLVVAPVSNHTPTIPQEHWSHFSLYGTKDTGAYGTDPITGIGNNPEIYVWLDDIPIMKAFVCSGNGTRLTATVGVFTQGDVGNDILDSAGATHGIGFLCDIAGARVYSYSSPYALCADVFALDECSMGADATLEVTQANQTVTLVAGWSIAGGGAFTFTAADVGKPIFFANGDIDWITGFVDANHVTVRMLATRLSTAACIDPTTRDFGDTVTDDTIRARANYAEFNCNHRFFAEMPFCDIGCTVPGFLAGAERGTSIVYYSAMSVKKPYLAGYYYPAFQFDNKPQDKIQRLKSFPDRLVAYCNSSTWATDTNRTLDDTIPNIGISIPILPNLNLVDNIGVSHINSVKSVAIGQDILLTSEPGIRLFDGYKFSENLAYQQVGKTIEGLATFVNAHYDPISGYILWGAEEEI